MDELIGEISKKLGIGRTKAFAALSAANGADDDALNSAVKPYVSNTGNPYEATCAYLISQPHIRFSHLGNKDWTQDVDLLREIVKSDASVQEYALAHIDETGLTETVRNAINNLFTGTQPDRTEEDGLDYYRLAGKQELIEQLLGMTHWANKPALAVRVLRLNPFEARALAAADVAKAPVKTTQMLWEKYDPQYCTWLPFAAIGVLAIIALGDLWPIGQTLGPHERVMLYSPFKKECRIERF